MLNLLTTAATAARDHRPGKPCEVLADLPQALLVLDTNRHLLFANTAALPVVQASARLLEGCLHRLGQLDATQLDRLLAMAASGTASRCSLWFSPSLNTGWLHAAPLSPAIAQAEGWPAGCVLLAVHVDQPELTHAARIEAMTLRFGLSPAERHVLLLLADGEPVDAVSRLLGLRVSTVRSHVRQLLTKCQAPSLMQLMRWTGSARALPH
ncbi:helix-turn-helix transcriptional regulator [Roseateles sp. BYS87W]|uniref:LuxR C-terminal-related transcriptional regulator n=1 Tax=Pelomonas baiyunensis TaxID=3299026 RepID=A0ABW7GSZ3_9BURK